MQRTNFDIQRNGRKMVHLSKCIWEESVKSRFSDWLQYWGFAVTLVTQWIRRKLYVGFRLAKGVENPRGDFGMI